MTSTLTLLMGVALGSIATGFTIIVVQVATALIAGRRPKGVVETIHHSGDRS